MQRLRGSGIGVVMAAVGLLALPAASSAQTVTGQAVAAQATVYSLLGTNVLSFANTGNLTGPTDAEQASALSGNILNALTGQVPQATTIGYPDQVDSEASLSNLSLSIAGNSIGADFVMSQASTVLSGASTGSAMLTNLTLNGVPVTVTGSPNQAVAIPGGQMVINEQQTSPGGIVVNALHVIVSGVADVVVGSSVAGIQ
ncbi:MAG: hypothetical protein M0015_07065 [Betaproteobacteria bacterium]|nr:hypothetical protein [Betaproteobacteria bacterium]